MQPFGSDTTTALTVSLEGYAMHVRPSELAAVAAGWRELSTFGPDEPLRLAEALRGMPVLDRPPVWELVVRHFGRRKPLAQAAGEIGMDVLHAQDLLERFADALARVP